MSIYMSILQVYAFKCASENSILQKQLSFLQQPLFAYHTLQKNSRIVSIDIMHVNFYFHWLSDDNPLIFFFFIVIYLFYQLIYLLIIIYFCRLGRVHIKALYCRYGTCLWTYYKNMSDIYPYLHSIFRIRSIFGFCRAPKGTFTFQASST